MAKSPKDKDQDKANQRRDELAKRVLNTPPQPKTAEKGKPRTSESGQKQKPDGPPAKKDHPGKQ